MSVARQVKRVGVELLMNKPINIYDIRKLLFARFISYEKNLPFIGYLVDEGVSSEIDNTSKEKKLKRQLIQAQNREILSLIQLPFDRQVSVDEGLNKTIQSRLQKLDSEVIEKKGDRDVNLKIPFTSLEMKDMRVGQFTYALEKLRESSVIHIQRKGQMTSDFLMANSEESGDELVLVENEVIITY